MTRFRLLVTLLVAGLAVSFGLTSCDSGSGRGEKVMDVLPAGFGQFKLAAADDGTVALATAGENLELRELRPTTWHWSKPEVVATFARQDGFPLNDVALAYDGSGRLLVAWAVSLDDDHSRIKARIRDSDGNWQPARLIARYGGAGFVALTLSAARRSFALGWHAEYSHTSAFRILQGDRWLPPVSVRTEAQPVEVQLLESRPPLTLWILPGERKLMYASLRPDGKLSDARVLANADLSLVSSFDSTQAVAGWRYKNQAWAAAWNGRSWTNPKKLGAWNEDDPAISPIATAVSRGQAAVVWGQSWNYALWRQGNWTPASSLAQDDYGSEVSAGALGSGEIVLAGFGKRLTIAHVLASGSRTVTKYSINQGEHVIHASQTSASSAKAAALAWVNEVQPGEDYPIEHLFVWVYRP